VRASRMTMCFGGGLFRRLRTGREARVMVGLLEHPCCAENRFAFLRENWGDHFTSNPIDVIIPYCYVNRRMGNDCSHSAGL